ncbi:MAG: antibiotic resistance protein MarC [Ignavibacteriae bacterium]|nr:antibiotic resistance protein MarC [Ignavibacteriota bacterium]|tara:strand:- start:29 stop:667 length:639 start_codon:yes stop_codon:yes gene_type:complete
MDNLFDFGLLAFTSVFTMVNPIGVIPLYTALTSDYDVRQSRRIAVRAIITAFITMMLFAFGGKFILEFFHISINSLRIVGGIIFFIAGYDMLQAQVTRTKAEDENDSYVNHDIAITPLGIPMICGPGSITISIVLMSDAEFMIQKAVLISSIIIVLLITLVFLLSAKKIIGFLGESGSKVLTRIMGLIVMVIAVEFIFSGLKPFVQDMLGIN